MVIRAKRVSYGIVTLEESSSCMYSVCVDGRIMETYSDLSAALKAFESRC